MIRYKLKKDLPDAKVGTILTKEDKPNGLYMYCGKFDGTDPSSWYAEEAIESAPDWFELIKEEPKEVFTWDDEKAKEFYTFCYNNVFKQPTYPEEMIERFKQSKASTTVNLTLNDSHRVTNTSKERIEVEEIQFSAFVADHIANKGRYYFVTNNQIHTKYFPLIKQAIEAVLNNEGDGKEHWYWFNEWKELTERHQKDIENAFNAARERKPLKTFVDPSPGQTQIKYPTLESYLQTIKK